MRIPGPQNNVRWDVSWFLNKSVAYVNEISDPRQERESSDSKIQCGLPPPLLGWFRTK